MKEVTGLDRMPFEQLFNAAIQRCRAHIIAADRLSKANGKPGIGLSIQNQPTLLLTLFASLCLSRRGVHLHRQFLASEEIFCQQAGQLRWRLKPNFANALASGRSKRRRQSLAAPNLFHHSSGKDFSRCRTMGVHWFVAPSNLPTFCAASRCVTRISSPSATMMMSVRPSAETRGPSLTTVTFAQSTSSLFSGA